MIMVPWRQWRASLGISIISISYCFHRDTTADKGPFGSGSCLSWCFTTTPTVGLNSNIDYSSKHWNRCDTSTKTGLCRRIYLHNAMMSLESNCGTKKFRRIRKEFGSRNIRKLIPFENNTLYGIAYHSIHSTGVNDHYCCQDFLMINHYFIYTINIKYTPYIIHTHCQLIKSNKSGIDATGIRIAVYYHCFGWKMLVGVLMVANMW